MILMSDVNDMSSVKLTFGNSGQFADAERRKLFGVVSSRHMQRKEPLSSGSWPILHSGALCGTCADG